MMAVKTGFDMIGGDDWAKGLKSLFGDNEELFGKVQQYIAGMLQQAGVGMQIQNESARSRNSNARPGQYLGWRQRQEIANPPSSADILGRLGFHGGMANGKWTYDYDTWKAASKNGHGTNSRGEEIVVHSFGPRTEHNTAPTKKEVDDLNKSIKDHASAITVSDAKDEDGNTIVAARPKSTNHTKRTVTIRPGGGRTYSWVNKDGVNPADHRAAAEKAEQISGSASRDEKWDKVIAELEADGTLPKRAAVGGGQAMRERGWLDAVFNGGIVRAALKGGNRRR